MKDLLQELRWWYDSNPDPRIKKAADEIERLNFLYKTDMERARDEVEYLHKELKHYSETYDKQKAANEGLLKRIEQLEADLELATARYGVAQMRIEQFEARYNKNEIKWQNIASGQLRRTEQLEAALRQIIDYHDIGGEHVITCQRIAKQALKGDNDDTV